MQTICVSYISRHFFTLNKSLCAALWIEYALNVRMCAIKRVKCARCRQHTIIIHGFCDRFDEKHIYETSFKLDAICSEMRKGSFQLDFATGTTQNRIEASDNRFDTQALPKKFQCNGFSFVIIWEVKKLRLIFIACPMTSANPLETW